MKKSILIGAVISIALIGILASPAEAEDSGIGLQPISVVDYQVLPALIKLDTTQDNTEDFVVFDSNFQSMLLLEDSNSGVGLLAAIGEQSMGLLSYEIINIENPPPLGVPEKYIYQTENRNY